MRPESTRRGSTAAIGVVAKPVAPWPSCPLDPTPQPYIQFEAARPRTASASTSSFETVPMDYRPITMECDSPAEMCVTVFPAKAPLVDIATGISRVVDVPSLSLPNALSPTRTPSLPLRRIASSYKGASPKSYS